MREIHFYQTETDFCPVEEFLDSLTAKQAQKTAWVMQLIEEIELVPVQYFKKLVNTDDIWEVRVQAGNNIFRILGFLDDERLVVLNHAFQKKTQKTPKKEIKIAEKRKKDYLSRR
jgi:phage-related protein